MIKIKSLSVLFIFIFLSINLVYADGCIIPHETNNKDVHETSQTALIVYEDGIEDIYLTVNFAGEVNKFVWILSTPSFPKVGIAPKTIFNELAVFTGEPVSAGAGDSQTTEKLATLEPGVVVHSQEQVGMYEMTVLSATNADDLFKWLILNKYAVKEDDRKILNWYVAKGWYFTAIKISPQNNLERSIEALRNIDNTVTRSNFSEKFANYYNDSFRSNNFNQFQNSLSIMKILIPKDVVEIESKNSIEKFNAIRDELSVFTDVEWSMVKHEAMLNAENILIALEKENIPKSNDYIEPIKISFSIDKIIYPLKISQISTKAIGGSAETAKTNKVLLYILSDKQVTAPGFSNEYSREASGSRLNIVNNDTNENLDNLKKIVGESSFVLTKLRRNFAREEMNEDVYITNGTDYSPVPNDEIRPLSKIDTTTDENPPKQKNKLRESAMADRLKGRIILKIEDHGKAFYINPITKYYYYFGRPADAFFVMREQGVGITNSNLEKIPLGLNNLTGVDNDGDGLPDLLEDAIGADKNKQDTDGDGYTDKLEMENGYSPNGGSRNDVNINHAFANAQKGKIFLQVEGSGEAWYVHPGDGKRYFLGRPEDAFSVMQNLGLGISNTDFDSL